MEALEMTQTILDGYAARILLGTSGRAVSALELSRRFGIPIAACYRRIRELETLGLVYCERSLPSRNGKGLQLFRSRVRSLRIALEDGALLARIEFDGPQRVRESEGSVHEQVLRLAPDALSPGEPS